MLGGNGWECFRERAEGLGIWEAAWSPPGTVTAGPVDGGWRGRDFEKKMEREGKRRVRRGERVREREERERVRGREKV